MNLEFKEDTAEVITSLVKEKYVRFIKPKNLPVEFATIVLRYSPAATSSILVDRSLMTLVYFFSEGDPSLIAEFLQRTDFVDDIATAWEAHNSRATSYKFCFIIGNLFQ